MKECGGAALSTYFKLSKIFTPKTIKKNCSLLFVFRSISSSKSNWNWPSIRSKYVEEFFGDIILTKGIFECQVELVRNQI